MNQEKSVDNQIDEIILECKIYRFASELQNTDDEERKTDLRKILNMYQRSEQSPIKTNTARQKIDDMFDKIEESSLKKRWLKLNIIQKKNRIEQFVSNMVMDDNKKEEYKKKLLNMLENKKLKKTLVDYNNTEGIITSIEVEV